MQKWYIISEACLLIVGFIDGKKIKIARLSGNIHRRSVYSGHKRMHWLSYRTIAALGEIIFHMHRSIEGRQSDAYLYLKSTLDTVVGDNLFTNGIQ